jgi:hypothetical protein
MLAEKFDARATARAAKTPQQDKPATTPAAPAPAAHA